MSIRTFHARLCVRQYLYSQSGLKSHPNYHFWPLIFYSGNFSILIYFSILTLILTVHPRLHFRQQKDRLRTVGRIQWPVCAVQGGHGGCPEGVSCRKSETGGHCSKETQEVREVSPGERWGESQSCGYLQLRLGGWWTSYWVIDGSIWLTGILY